MRAPRPLPPRAAFALPRAELWRALLGLVALAAVLASTLRVDRSYFHCIPMQRVMAATCCADDHDADEHRGQELRSTCCVKKQLAAVPQHAPSGDELRPSAPPALAPSFAVPLPRHEHPRSVELPTARVARPAVPIRAGPLYAADRCADLSVFHC